MKRSVIIGALQVTFWSCVYSMEETYLATLPVDILKTVLFNYVKNDPLISISMAGSMPLEKRISYQDTLFERQNFLVNLSKQNHVSIKATYAMPSPSHKKIIYLINYYDTTPQYITHTAITVIDLEKKLDIIERAIDTKTAAVAINNKGNVCAFLYQISATSYAVALYDSSKHSEHIVHRIDLPKPIPQSKLFYKTLISFFPDDRQIMVQLPHGAIYTYSFYKDDDDFVSKFIKKKE